MSVDILLWKWGRFGDTRELTYTVTGQISGCFFWFFFYKYISLIQCDQSDTITTGALNVIGTATPFDLRFFFLLLFFFFFFFTFFFCGCFCWYVKTWNDATLM